jgi:hypothetical protein
MIRAAFATLALVLATQGALAGSYATEVQACTNRCIDEHGHSGEAQAYQCKRQCQEQSESEDDGS